MGVNLRGFSKFAKCHSIEETLETANQYLIKFPYGCEDEALLSIRENI